MGALSTIITNMLMQSIEFLRETNFSGGGTDNYEQTEESRIAEILCYKI